MEARFYEGEDDYLKETTRGVVVDDQIIAICTVRSILVVGCWVTALSFNIGHTYSS